MSLFGGAAAQARTRNLVEFKAGKMNLRGHMVYPDKRKGLVYLHQGNDMLMHLCWKDRSSNTAEDDLVIFPDETEFKKVTQNTTGRVYILKWKSNARKFFFWMQEPNEDKDEENCKKINDLLNNPPTPSFGDSSSGSNPLQPLMERMAGGSAGGLDPNDLPNVLRGMNPSEFASLLSSLGGGGASGATAAGLMQGLQRGGRSMGTSTQQGTSSSSRANPFAQQSASSRPNTAPTVTRTTGTTSTTANRSGASSSSSSSTAPTNATNSAASGGSKSGAIQMSTLSNVLANLNNTPTQETETTAASSKSSLDNASSASLIPLLANKDIQGKLRSHLPEGHTIPSTEKELRDSISSPQFQQVVNAFSVALQSGELRSVLSQFNFPDEVTNAATQGDLQAFAQALAKHYNKSSDNTMDTN